MTVRTMTRSTLAAAGAAVLGASLAAPAYAAERSFTDPADAPGSPSDIRTVTVRHDESRVRVSVEVTDLRRQLRRGASGMTIALDTRGGRPGPEFGLTTGLQSGTDYQLHRVRNGRVVGEPLTCPHRVRLRFADDVAVFTAARSCLGDPARVRISVRTRLDRPGEPPIVDWLGARRSFTRWVASS